MNIRKIFRIKYYREIFRLKDQFFRNQKLLNINNRQLLGYSEPKVLFCALPVLHVGATIKSKKPKDSSFGPNGAYRCPCYNYPRRTDLYYIFMVDLPAGKHTKAYWTLRGTALLCSTD